MINASNITTESQLSDLLTSLGFETEPVHGRDRPMAGDRDLGTRHELIAQYMALNKNNLTTDVMIAVDGQQFRAYAREQINNFWFVETGQLDGNITSQDLVNLVQAAEASMEH